MDVSVDLLLGFKSVGAPNAKIILSAKSLAYTRGFEESVEVGHRTHELAPCGTALEERGQPQRKVVRRHWLQF